MKYVIEQFVMKIKAPIVCKYDGKETSFDSGEELAAYQFDKRYNVDTVTIEEDKVVITLAELATPNINSVGDEQVSGEDWIEEHKRRFGKEPNLFDGA
jgi:hypothetical protein